MRGLSGLRAVALIALAVLSFGLMGVRPVRAQAPSWAYISGECTFTAGNESGTTPDKFQVFGLVNWKPPSEGGSYAIKPYAAMTDNNDSGLSVYSSDSPDADHYLGGVDLAPYATPSLGYSTTTGSGPYGTSEMWDGSHWYNGGPQTSNYPSTIYIKYTFTTSGYNTIDQIISNVLGISPHGWGCCQITGSTTLTTSLTYPSGTVLGTYTDYPFSYAVTILSSSLPGY